MCSLNLKSKHNSRVCDHRAILSLPSLPCHCLFPPCVYTCACVHTHTCALTSTHSPHTDTQCIYRHSHTHSLTPSLALPCQYLFLSGIIFLDVFFVVLPTNHPRSQDPGIFSQDVEIPDIFAQRDKSKCTSGLLETCFL